MKLNSWGYMQMFILSSVIVFFLLVVVYNVSVFNDNFNKNVTINYYYGLEERFEKQSLAYINDYYEDILTNEDIVITNDMLDVYGLSIALYDKNNNDCAGYVLASKTRGIVSADAYISCKKYETLGYQNWRV